MNLELEKLIEFSLSDGEITDKEMKVILNKANKLGITVDMVQIIIESKKNTTKSKGYLTPSVLNNKKKLEQNKITINDLFLGTLNYKDNFLIHFLLKPICLIIKSLYSFITFLMDQLVDSSPQKKSIKTSTDDDNSYDFSSSFDSGDSGDFE